MLETIHEYARERLDETTEADELRSQHAQFFLNLAEQVERELDGPNPAVWVRRLEAEHDNCRAALGWLIGHEQVEDALRLAAAMGPFWFAQGYLSEANDWLAKALALSDANGNRPTRDRARACFAASNCFLGRSEYARSRSYAEESLAIARQLDDKKLVSTALNDVNYSAYRFDSAYNAAVAMLEESLVLSRSAGNKHGQVRALLTSADVIADHGDDTRAASLAAEALTLSRELNYETGIIDSLRMLGFIAFGRGDYEAARTLLWQVLDAHRAQGHAIYLAASLLNLGAVLIYLKEYELARGLSEEGLAMMRRNGNRYGAALVSGNLGYIEMKLGNSVEAGRLIAKNLKTVADLKHNKSTIAAIEYMAYLASAAAKPEKSVRLFGAAEALSEATDRHLDIPEQADHDEYIGLIREALDTATFAALWAEGRAMTLEQAIAYALQDTEDD
jgi:hypothetical protein